MIQRTWNVTTSVSSTIPISWHLPSRGTIRMPLKFTSLVDGGYLSFLIGSRDVPGLWQSVRGEFKRALICMDHRSYRKDIYPDYKSRRAVNRWADQHKQQTYDAVREFRKTMELDSSI